MPNRKFLIALIAAGALMMNPNCGKTHGFFASRYSAKDMMTFVYSLFNSWGDWQIIERTPDQLVIARPYDKEKIRFQMPMKNRRHDPFSYYGYDKHGRKIDYGRFRRNRWDIDERDFKPIHRADEFVTFFARHELDGRTGIVIRHDVFANYGMYDEVHVRKDDKEYFTLGKYCETFLDGGVGAGFSTVFRDGHMFVADVFEGSAAERAGIQAGDRIRLINKTVADTVDPEKFGKKYQWAEVGKQFTLDLERPSGERYHVELAVGYIPAQVERLKKAYRRVSVPKGKTYQEAMRTYNMQKH